MLSNFDPWAVLAEIRSVGSEGSHRAKAAKAANPDATHGLDGLSVLGRIPRERGLTLRHPWHGFTVDCPRGPGRFLWTDGFRCAVGGEGAAWLVNLEQVRLTEEPATDSGGIESRCPRHGGP